MSSAKHDLRAYPVECLDCCELMASGLRQCPHCGAAVKMIDRVNEVLKRAHERRDDSGIYPPIRPVVIRRGG